MDHNIRSLGLKNNSLNIGYIDKTNLIPYTINYDLLILICLS